MQEIAVGAAKLNVINLGDLRFSLREVISTPEAEWRQKYGTLFEQRLSFPSQSILISAAGAFVLVDAGEYSKFAAEGGEYAEDGYSPPPNLAKQLGTLGVGVDDIDHVVITHAHYDHFAGVTTTGGGSTEPTFPKARYYLGRGDWEWDELRRSLSDRSSNEYMTLGIVAQLGALELVSERKELVSGVSIIQAPGESPGHQIVKVQSEGESAYCVGDLFHHAVEVENPRWMASWCDPPLNLESREILIESAVREGALVVPAHMRPGKISRVGLRTEFLELGHSTRSLP